MIGTKRFIVFAFDDERGGGGWKDIFGVTSSLNEADRLVAEAKKSPYAEYVQVYDIDQERLLADWIKLINHEWVKREPD